MGFARHAWGSALFVALISAGSIHAQGHTVVESPSVAIPEARDADAPIRFFGSIDYLLFTFRDGPAPPLIQHVPTDQFTQPLDPNAPRTMFGDGIRHHAFNGFYLSGGAWVTECFGVDASYAQFETKDKKFFINSPGDPSIGRYFVDLTNSSSPYTYLVYSRPDGTETGWISVSSPIQFWHADTNVRGHGFSVFSDRVDWLVGFHYADLRDGIFIQDYTAFPSNGVSLAGDESFRARNQFYGGQVGANAWTGLGCGFSLDVTSKFAVGGIHQRASITGSTVQALNGVTTAVYAGDVLAQSTNIGDYERTKFGVLSELLVKLGYQVTNNICVTVGYDLVAISSVVRAGSIIDEGVNPNVNPTLSPSSASTAQRPAFGFNATDFWAQGLTLGLSVKY
ncbi:MAG: BBP7 family outer membrane beta-barrel protein [Gemmataceae bacterium]